MPSKKKKGRKNNKRNKKKPVSRGSDGAGDVPEAPSLPMMLDEDLLSEEEEEEDDDDDDKKLPARPTPAATGADGTAAAPSRTEGTTTTTTTTSDQEPPSIRELDEEDNRRKFLFRGNGEKITPERLLKHMPKAAQLLREGKLSAEDFATELTLASLNDKKNAAREELLKACFEIANQAWPVSPETFAERELHRKFISELLQRALHHAERLLESVVLQHDVKSRDEVKTAFYDNVVNDLQMDFERVCRACSKQLDRKYFSSKTGAFIRFCPIYGLTQQQWEEEFKDWILSSFKKYDELFEQHWKVKNEVTFAAQAVVRGSSDVWTCCWECGENVKDCNHCSRCSVARYCCRDCQVAAWHGGHNAACSKHKDVYGKLLENLRTEDEAHDAGRAHGSYPDERKDREIILLLASYEFLDVDTSDFMGPSLKFFYKNVGQIARGEWWIYRAPDSPDAFKEKIQHPINERMRKSYMISIYFALSFDLPGYVARRNGGNVTSEGIESAFYKLAANVTSEPKSEAKMPAELFLEIYGANRNSRPCRGEKRATCIKAAALASHRKFENSLKHNNDELNSV